MEYPLLLAILFGAGVLIEAFALTKDKKINRFILLLALLFSLSAFLPAESESIYRYNIYSHIVSYFLIFSICIAIAFKKEILPEISEQTVLTFTLVFWFIVLTNFTVCLPVIILAIIPTLGTLALAFTSINLGFKTRAFFYIWFLIMVVFIVASQFSFGTLSDLLNQKNIESLNPFEAIITGMALIYLLAYSMYLFQLISLPPFPGKHKSLGDKIKQKKEHISLLVSKYSNHQLKTSHALIILLIGGGILSLNHIFDILPDYLLINTFIVLIPQLAGKVILSKIK